MTIIFVIEQTTDNRVLIFPVTPDEINFSANGTRFVKYEILDRGDVKIPNGENLRTVKWKGILPNPSRPLPFTALPNIAQPKYYQSMFSIWKAKGTPLKLYITGTPVNMDVYISDYKVKYKGPHGDFEYEIEFVDRKDLSISSKLLDRPELAEVQEGVREEQVRAATLPETYTTLEGDSWWSIAEKILGSGNRWHEVREINPGVDKGIRKFIDGKIQQEWYNYIPPGTVVKIPQPHVPVVQYGTLGATAAQNYSISTSRNSIENYDIIEIEPLNPEPEEGEENNEQPTEV